VPTYQYACTECDHRLEAVQAFSDEPLIQCVECGGRLRKLFNSVGIVFKGSGFYRNDSREKPAKADAKGAEQSPEKSGDAAGVKSDTKAEGAAGAKSGQSGSGGTKSDSSGSTKSGSGSSTAGSAA
jgi:putative FmdB family regulatory protein